VDQIENLSPGGFDGRDDLCDHLAALQKDAIVNHQLCFGTSSCFVESLEADCRAHRHRPA